MFISDALKLVFFEVPRTGSNSVTAALNELDPEAPTAKTRSQRGVTFDYHVFMLPTDLPQAGYRLLAAHRNPYERLWSHWKFRNKYGNPPVFRTTSWERYVQWACDPSSAKEIRGAMLDVPICEMFDCDRVDNWLQFEDLEQSWLKLSKDMGIALPPLPLKHSSPIKGDFRDAYNHELASLVFTRFAADFERFGYDPDSWKRSHKNNEPNLLSISNNLESKEQELNKPKIAILTHFQRSFTAFSLNRVVQDQIAMLVGHGYDTTVLVSESSAWDSPEGKYADPRIKLVQLPNFAEIIDEENPSETEQEIAELSEALASALDGIDVVFTHDIVYMGRSKKLMQAAWNTAKKQPKLKWLHWIHSAANPALINKTPSAAAIHSKFVSEGWANSQLIFFNHMSIPRLAEWFGYAEADIKIVPHPLDVCTFFGFSSLTSQIYESYQLYDADYIAISPTRLTSNKQIEWVIKIMSRLKFNGAKVRLLLLDFHSNKDKSIEYRSKLKRLADEWGMDASDAVFISEFDESLRFEAPHSMVRELFSLSHVFIQPSVSESYSLAAQEAAALGNLLVLNTDFPPMHEMYGEHAMYFHFSSYMNRDTLKDGQTITRFQEVEFGFEPPNVPSSLVTQKGESWFVGGDVAYADQIARKIIEEFASNMVLAQRQMRLRDRNLYSIFRNHLEPLLTPSVSVDRPI